MLNSFKFLLNKYVVTVLWFGLSLFAVIKQAAGHQINNWFIYKYVFINLTHHENLYTQQPAHFFDSNHYGPVFALLIAPFTIVPDFVGVILWVMFNALMLYIAITQLPLKEILKVPILLICAHELMTASFNVQFNPTMTALIIMSYVFVNRKQDIWATLMIAIGIYIKLYGIVGLAFFFFSKDKLKFIWTFLMWMVVLFVAPMLISSKDFVIQCYHDWYNSLAHKNNENTDSVMQDISVMGMIRRIFGFHNLSNVLVILPGFALLLMAYIRTRLFNNVNYQLLLLCSVLLFTVIFSTGSESPTYIIAFTGVGIWFMNLKRPVSGFEIFLLVFALIITSLSPSDLFPQSVNRNFIRPYALKALPCLLIWLKIIHETLTRKFKPTNSTVAV
ncbi:glycosyltransferase family 87 protein [Mucilaginibacter ginkgonis]|uniref:DUF2029 domain-containing protein n=1 Tax=Mucilaginibacter ginkgonis TaxID=2682091 RepID=A0A6I4HWF4_9SPHI|nr:glycosyltransferase family 87 protein [Mucilaginibacter ginkgonis]QQL51168.1 DUF2029 domain-containing protein [Mucilaginibacter ginkgonis]